MHAADSRWSGAMTAIVTPFREDGEVDHEALAALAWSRQGPPVKGRHLPTRSTRRWSGPWLRR